MVNSCENFEKGFLIRADGFQVKIQPDGAGGVHVQYYGTVPRKLKYVIEKHKNLFVNPDFARTLICNEISHL
jgi:hypothetical protein